MIKKINRIIASALLVSGAVIFMGTPVALAAPPATPAPPATSGGATNILDGAGTTGQAGDFKVSIKTIVNLLLFILGLISVIVIIVGGIRYTTSGGDSAAVKGAKDTILFAVVGLVVALLAFAIVNFVVTQFQ